MDDTNVVPAADETAAPVAAPEETTAPATDMLTDDVAPAADEEVTA